MKNVIVSILLLTCSIVGNNIYAASHSRLQPAKCPFTIPMGEAAVCNYLTVPENRADKSSNKTIKLFVATLKNHTNGRTDPIVILTGGPGNSASSRIKADWTIFAPLLRNHDIIYVDQRGTGLSKPRLDCPEISFTAISKTTDKQLKSCHDRLVKKVDLSAFNTKENAQDFVALRKALGIKQWSLIGTSYGTRLALQVMRIDPQGIRSVVLNSPVANSDIDFTAANFAYTKSVYQKMFRDCKASPACNKAYPNLQQEFLYLMKQMQKKPIKFKTIDPKTGRTITITETANDFIYLMNLIIGSGKGSEMIPKLIHTLYGKYAGTAKVSDAMLTKIFHVGPATPVVDFAWGVNLTMACAEQVPYWKDIPKLTREIKTTYAPYISTVATKLYLPACKIWNVKPINCAFRQPVVSDIPTLILIGSYDSLTPHMWSEEISKTLKNSQILYFKGLGHNIIANSPCSVNAVTEFLNNPQQKVLLACVGRYDKPLFK